MSHIYFQKNRLSVKLVSLKTGIIIQLLLPFSYMDLLVKLHTFFMKVILELNFKTFIKFIALLFTGKYLLTDSNMVNKN